MPTRTGGQFSSTRPALGLWPQQLASLGSGSGGSRGWGVLSTGHMAPLTKDCALAPPSPAPRDGPEAESLDRFLVEAVTSRGHGGLLPPDSSPTVGSPFPYPRGSPYSTLTLLGETLLGDRLPDPRGGQTHSPPWGVSASTWPRPAPQPRPRPAAPGPAPRPRLREAPPHPTGQH